jgi:hypothetical protein
MREHARIDVKSGADPDPNDDAQRLALLEIGDALLCAGRRCGREQAEENEQSLPHETLPVKGCQPRDEVPKG